MGEMVQTWLRTGGRTWRVAISDPDQMSREAEFARSLMNCRADAQTSLRNAFVRETAANFGLAGSVAGPFERSPLLGDIP